MKLSHTKAQEIINLMVEKAVLVTVHAPSIDADTNLYMLSEETSTEHYMLETRDGLVYVTLLLEDETGEDPYSYSLAIKELDPIYSEKAKKVEDLAWDYIDRLHVASMGS